MKLYTAKIDPIARDIIAKLVADEAIETAERTEAELDVASVLKEYIRLDRELTDRAKDIMEIRGLGYSAFGRTKRGLAEKKDFGLGDEGLNWMATQILEIFMQSKHIEEVYDDDASLRRKIKGILTKHTKVDDEIDREVRQRIKNLEEGTSTWDMEYSRVMGQIKQKHGISE